MRIKHQSGYTTSTYIANFSNQPGRILIGEGLEARIKFDAKTKRPVETGEIESKRAWVYFPGLGVQTVKLPADYELDKNIEDMAEVELINPEACIVGQQIYVRADGLKVK